MKFKYSLIKKKINFILFLCFYVIKLNEKIIYIKKPKVSIFLPIYNKQSYLKRSISSIQKQSLKKLEIIAVNDFSTDNSLKTLRKLAKKDNRIKIVNNDRNHGLLYSRAMGILNCTGEYVLNLDPDDMISNKKNSNIPFKNQYLITNKFIKREIILKAYNAFKNSIYWNKWNYHEDHIWSELINKYSKSRLFLNEYCYFYLLNKVSLMRNLGNILELKNKIYRFEMYRKIYKNNLYIFNKFLALVNENKNLIQKDFETNKIFIYIFVNFIVFYKNFKSFFLKNIINKILINKITNIFKLSSKRPILKLL